MSPKLSGFVSKTAKISQGRDSIPLDLKIIEEQGEINSDREFLLPSSLYTGSSSRTSRKSCNTCDRSV